MGTQSNIAIDLQPAGDVQIAPAGVAPLKTITRIQQASDARQHGGDRQIATAGKFAIAADAVQWIVQRWTGSRWLGVKFVRSTKVILARCLREARATPAEVEALISGFPEQFDDYRETTAPPTLLAA